MTMPGVWFLVCPAKMFGIVVMACHKLHSRLGAQSLTRRARPGSGKEAVHPLTSEKLSDYSYRVITAIGIKL